MTNFLKRNISKILAAAFLVVGIYTVYNFYLLDPMQKAIRDYKDTNKTFLEERSVHTDSRAEDRLKYAKALIRQHDFTNDDPTASVIEAINIYYNTAKDVAVESKYRVFAANEIFTAYLYTGGNTKVLENIFNKSSVEVKKNELKISEATEQLNRYQKGYIYENLLVDFLNSTAKETGTSTGAIVGRSAMMSYMNQMLYRTQIDLTSSDAQDKNKAIKDAFAKKVISEYEIFKSSSPNSLSPNDYYAIESSYLMAWALNRAAIYTDDKQLEEESYQLFKTSVEKADTLKDTRLDLWHLSVIARVYYASAVLGSNKDAFIDPENKEKRDRALSILSEISNPDFIKNPFYFGAQKYLRGVRLSDMDWTTTLMLLSKYDEGLAKNLKALGWRL